MIERLHPLTVFLYFLCTIGFSMTNRDPVFLGISLLAGSLFLIGWKKDVRKKITLREILTALVFFLLVTIMNPLFNHRGDTVLFYINKNRITLEASAFGAVAGLMLLAVFVWCGSLAYFMTSDKILFLFSSLSKKGALVLSMVLRFLPDYSREFRRRKEAAKLLGLYGSNSPAEKLRANVLLFSATADHAMEHSVETADSMTARGYDSGRRSRYKTIFFRRADRILCIAMTGGAGLLIFLMVRWPMRMQFYPVLSFPELSPQRILTYAVYAILCALIPVYGGIKKCQKKS